MSIKQGQTLTKDDLNVFLYVGASLSDPFTVTYTLYDSTTGTDQIIGLPDRYPIKFGTGQYYAPWSIPDDEPVGAHKVVWKYKESATSEILSETEDFEIIPLCSALVQQFPDFILYLINQLRIKLRDINPDRDYSIAGEELITLDIDSKEVTLSIGEFYNVVNENNLSDIKEAFKEGKIKIKACSKDGIIVYKKVSDVLRHFSLIKDIYKITLENSKTIIVTEDHSLFVLENNEIKKIKPIEFPKDLAFFNGKLASEKVLKVEKIEKREYMFDLSVEDFENFFTSSGFLVSNSFAPPSSEKTIAGFTRVRGYRWPDEQLYGHLVQSANMINLIPPDTDFRLESYPAIWQPILLLQAMTYALMDLSILWIGEEFSYSLNGISLDISRSDKYQSAAQSMQDMVNTQLEAAKTRVHVIKGLGQSRFTYGRGAALGPWCCASDCHVYNYENNLMEKIKLEDAYKKQIKVSYSMDLSNNNLIKNEVIKIWSNGIQKLFKMILDNRSEIKCTETHRFFGKKNNEVQLKDLDVGQEIWIKEKNILRLVKIVEIEYFGEDETYDMEMKEPFRNYIAEDIVVHNTGGQNIKRWVMGSSSGIAYGTGG